VAAALAAALVFGIGIMLRVVGLATAANVTQVGSLAPVVAGLVKWSRGSRPARVAGAGRSGVIESGSSATDARQAMGPVSGAPSPGELVPAEQGRVLGTGLSGSLPGRGGLSVPRQLPAAIRHFAGREAELTVLAGQVAGVASAVVISAVGGAAGIGKTTLAVHFAHQVAGQFPDGQLYVNLRGFGPAGALVTPAEAVRGFLEALAVPPERIPATADGQVALYRSLLAGRRVLVVLDNARDAGQVRPLLPGSPGCMVVVTSRNQLTGLIAAEGAHPVALDLLTAAEACQLLARRVGEDRVAAEEEAVRQVIDCCARLPLALAIAAARAAACSQFPLAALAGELRDASGSLHALCSAEDATADVRAVFSWSYRQLSPPAARLFRLLGAHPGPGIGAPAAASLAGLPLPEARVLLAELACASMTAQPAPGRYASHDLLRCYAAELSRSRDSTEQRDQAAGRLLDHYLHTACYAHRVLYPYYDQPTVPPPRPGTTPEVLADPAQALAWFTAERPVLLAAVEHAASTGNGSCAWQLAWNVGRFLSRQGRWHELAAMSQVAVAAAIRLADPQALAPSHFNLGLACIHLGRHGEALAHLRQALGFYRQAGSQLGQARVRTALGVLSGEQDRQAEALTHARRALALHTAYGNRHGQGLTLNNIGYTYALLGDYGKGVTYCQQALAILEEYGDSFEQANTLHSLGYASHHLGRHPQAVGYYRHAISIYRAISHPHLEGISLSDLGDTYAAAGDPAAAWHAWRQAAQVLDGHDYSVAENVRAKLVTIDASIRHPRDETHAADPRAPEPAPPSRLSNRNSWAGQWGRITDHVSLRPLGAIRLSVMSPAPCLRRH
jgi:tetratricopeptide (TPR) repeat protein